MITEYHDYNDTCDIRLVDLKLDNLPASIEVEGAKLYKKTEFHITLVSAKSVLRSIEGEPSLESLGDEIVEEFKKFITANQIKDYTLLPEFRLLKRGDSKTLVTMVKIDNNQKFFDLLREKYGAKIPDQPTHITIYSFDPETGLYINSAAELERDTHIVDVPELQNLAKIEP